MIVVAPFVCIPSSSLVNNGGRASSRTAESAATSQTNPSQTNPSLSQLRGLAQSRSVSQLDRLLDSASKLRRPFDCLRTGGCYDSGKYGWTVDPLNDPNGGHYVIFSTPITNEDIGVLMFRRTSHGLSYIGEDQNWGAKIIHNDLHLRLAPADHRAFLEANVLVRRASAGLTCLRVGPDYTVSKMTVDGRSVKWTAVDGVMLVNLKAGKSMVGITYSAKVYLPRYAGVITKDAAMLTTDYWYPMIARGPAPYRLTAVVQKDWTAVGQGTLVSKKSDGTNNIWTYDMPLPVSYYSFSAGPYQTASKKVDGITYYVWSAADPLPLMKAELDFMPPIIEYYSRTFGKYPFNRFGAMVEPAIATTAMEAYSYATYPSLPAQDPHEPSHSWWGGMISNTYLHSLWNESFADFSEGLFARHVPIGNQSERELAFVDHPDVTHENKAPSIASGSAFKGPAGSYLGYGKGSYVLMQLEQELGYNEITACMKQWIASHPYGQAGEWSQFEDVVRKRDGAKWNWFFKQWLDRPGVPKFEISQVKFVGGQLKFHVHFASQPYRMKVQYLTWSALTPETSGPALSGAKLSSFELVAARDHDYSVPVSAEASSVSFDPYRRLMRVFHPDEDPPTLEHLWSSLDRIALGNAPAVFEALPKVTTLPDDLTGRIVVVGQDNLDDPAVRAAFASAGIQIQGTEATWRGTTIDLSRGCAEAIVRTKSGLGMIVAGNPVFSPETGDAELALTDRLGRFLRGRTRPKTSGYWVSKKSG